MKGEKILYSIFSFSFLKKKKKKIVEISKLAIETISFNPYLNERK